MLNLRQPGHAVASQAAATVSSEYLRVLAVGAAGRGLDLAPFFASSAIGPGILSQRGARVGARAAKRLWTQVCKRLDDPLFGLRIAETLPVGAADLIEYLVRTSADVRGGLEKVARYAPLMSDVESITLAVSGNLATFRFQTEGDLPFPAEMIMGLLTSRARESNGPTWSLRQVSFAHEPLGPRAAYERIIQAPVRFGMPFTEVVFDRELLDIPLPGADARLNAILTVQAEGLLAMIAPSQAPRSLAETIERALTNGPRIGDFTLTGLADHLGMGVRTLQRRLRAEGLTHRSLVRRLRHDLAVRSLSAPLTQNQIARTLGYSGAGAFQRAFKSWSGVSPAEIRSKSRRRRKRNTSRPIS